MVCGAVVQPSLVIPPDSKRTSQTLDSEKKPGAFLHAYSTRSNRSLMIRYKAWPVGLDGLRFLSVLNIRDRRTDRTGKRPRHIRPRPARHI